MYYSLYINHHYHHDYHRRRRHDHRHHRRFFTKIQKRITDPNDPQRRWILWIISKTGYFGYMIRSVSLLRIRKEWTLPAVTWNNFNTYIRFVTRPESWIKRWILSVLSRRQNRNTNRTCIILVTRKKLLHNFARMSCKTLLFQYIPYCKTHLHLACLKQYLKANHPEYNER